MSSNRLYLIVTLLSGPADHASRCSAVPFLANFEYSTTNPLPLPGHVRIIVREVSCKNEYETVIFEYELTRYKRSVSEVASLPAPSMSVCLIVISDTTAGKSMT